ncbi:stemmadenine O-acetyltransferase [Ricinus communis]|uniref:Anthranilate N-benzoyltransferase protein, putative n=1 Tax=Ricinus communis TaxID=3988 RepID=B9RAL2_RICCO|nr:stemmadenine O-acetyltransferase [Ricinus communis]EEF51839.1 Anthranilate N-benzoyltransferase protein, putative [Ricinus communis]|eukprot:XP_002511237.1 vinorine synthase [Ricinus communis]
MGRNLELISKQIIKPSSPTPHHLRNYNLSFLDQIAPAAYVRLALFYEANKHTIINDSFGTSILLKNSLAKTLTHFYPLAGRALDDFVIHCNDEGAEYTEVRVPCKLSETIESKDAKDINLLFPYDMHFDFKKEILLAVQFNIFDCGGIAIGMSFSHKLVDGTSANAFVFTWAAITQGARDGHEVIKNLNLSAAIHFPSVDVSDYMPNKGTIRDKIATKRFTFNKSSIAALREAAGSNVFSADHSQVRRTTRYEAISAFIWRRLMGIFQSKPGQKNKEYAAVHAVNLRGRMAPPLDSNSFGNIWQYAVASSPQVLEIEKENQDYYHGILVNQLSKAIREINGDYIRKLQSGEWYTKWMKERIKNVEVIAFTSWCTFPMYDIDFGWGKPVFATSLGRPFRNVTVFTSNRNGDGIEAWVNLLEEDMAMFESDSEVLSFAS